MTNRKIVYWDSDVFLALINEDKSTLELQRCTDVWISAQKGDIHIVTSTLTSAEVIHKKGQVKLDPNKRHLVSNFFRQNFISQKPVTREIAELARDVVWDSNIKPKDAIHIATAAYYRLKSFHSFDKNLVDKVTIDVAGFPVSVVKPHAEAQAELPIPVATALDEHY